MSEADGGVWNVMASDCTILEQFFLGDPAQQSLYVGEGVSVSSISVRVSLTSTLG
jgi:hypothetical protein